MQRLSANVGVAGSISDQYSANEYPCPQPGRPQSAVAGKRRGAPTRAFTRIFPGWAMTFDDYASGRPVVTGSSAMAAAICGAVRERRGRSLLVERARLRGGSRADRRVNDPASRVSDPQFPVFERIVWPSVC